MQRRSHCYLALTLALFCVLLCPGCVTSSLSPLNSATQSLSPSASTANSGITATATNTTAPTSAADGIEQVILAHRGFKTPFDYASRSNVLAAQLVVTSRSDPAINGQDVVKFIEDYKSGTDCDIILVQYEGDTLIQVTLMLYQGGVLRCETTVGTAKTQYLFNDIISEGYDVYGIGEGGIKVLLAANIREIKDKEPVLADLTGKLDWFSEANGVEVRYTLAPSLSDTAKSGKKTLTTAEKKELKKLLLADPVYLFNVDLHKAVNYDLVISAEYDNHSASFHTLSNGSIWIGIDNVQYISSSKKLYDYIIGLTTINAYEPKMLDDVVSITVSYKSDDGTIHKISIKDKDTVDKVAKALASAKASEYIISFMQSPDLELTLHTNGKDIVCTVYGMKQLGSSTDAGDFSINRFYWYRSQEAVNLIRSLLK
jgi:hypothetical protein